MLDRSEELRDFYLLACVLQTLDGDELPVRSSGINNIESLLRLMWFALSLFYEATYARLTIDIIESSQ